MNARKSIWYGEDKPFYAPWVGKYGLLYPYGKCQCGCGRDVLIARDTNHRTWETVKGYPLRFVNGHNRRRYKSIKDLFYENITPGSVDECWEWPLSRVEPGYGRVRLGKTEYRTHRLSWELHFGPIPEDMFVLHHCDNPPCVNPSHLFLGTHQDNMDDMVRKDRQKKKR